MSGTVILFYRIDEKNTILDVHPDWDEVAISNDGEKATSSKVIGKGLWEFITGDATRMYLDSIIENCRASREVIVKPYRCDRPHLKRFMEMIVTPLENREVLVEHVEVKTEPITKPVQFSTSGSGASHKRCSICNRMKIGEDWIEPNKVREHFQDNNSESIKVRYSVCPRCQNY